MPNLWLAAWARHRSILFSRVTVLASDAIDAIRCVDTMARCGWAIDAGDLAVVNALRDQMLSVRNLSGNTVLVVPGAIGGGL